MTSKLNVLELFSGIGGMHFALNRVSELLGNYHFEVTAADNNVIANKVYYHNFLQHPLCKNVESLHAKSFDRESYSVLLMSPPCQPFSRLGKQNREEDFRCEALLYVIDCLKLSANPISYILLENVEGFETSTPRNLLVEVLLARGFEVQEFLLTPFQFGIPNSRPRYYLLARRTNDATDGYLYQLQNKPVDYFGECRNVSCDIKFSFTDQYHPCNPNCDQYHPSVQPLSVFLQKPITNQYLVDPSSIHKYHVCSGDRYESSCFTKGYPRHFGKSGSIVQELERESGISTYRFFTEFEIASLLGFPTSFSFPEDVSLKKRYALLGNSLCVPIVTQLLKLLLADLNE